MTSASVVLPASPPAISQPSSLDVCQAPWTGSLTVQAPLSSEEQCVVPHRYHQSLTLTSTILRRFRIMLAARDIMIDSVLLDRFLDEEEPIDFSRNASVVFARLPSGYCEHSRNTRIIDGSLQHCSCALSAVYSPRASCRDRVHQRHLYFGRVVFMEGGESLLTHLPRGPMLIGPSIETPDSVMGER